MSDLSYAPSHSLSVTWSKTSDRPVGVTINGECFDLTPGLDGYRPNVWEESILDPQVGLLWQFDRAWNQATPEEAKDALAAIALVDELDAGPLMPQIIALLAQFYALRVHEANDARLTAAGV